MLGGETARRGVKGQLVGLEEGDPALGLGALGLPGRVLAAACQSPERGEGSRAKKATKGLSPASQTKQWSLPRWAPVQTTKL